MNIPGHKLCFFRRSLLKLVSKLRRLPYSALRGRPVAVSIEQGGTRRVCCHVCLEQGFTRLAYSGELVPCVTCGGRGALLMTELEFNELPF